MQIKVVSQSDRREGLLRMSPEQRALVLEELAAHLLRASPALGPGAVPLAAGLVRGLDELARALTRGEDPGLLSVQLRRLLTFAAVVPVADPGGGGRLSENRLALAAPLEVRLGAGATVLPAGAGLAVAGFRLDVARLGAELYTPPALAPPGFAVSGFEPPGLDFAVAAALRPVPPALRLLALRDQLDADALGKLRLELADAGELRRWLARLDALARLLPVWRRPRRPPRISAPAPAPAAAWLAASEPEEPEEPAEAFDVLAFSAAEARARAERARVRLLEAERLLWARLARARAARRWGYEIARRLGLPLPPGFRPGDDLKALPPKARAAIERRMQLEMAQAAAVAANKCPHVRAAARFRRARTRAEAEAGFQALAKIFAKGAELGGRARGFVRCALCGFDLLCPHVVELHRLAGAPDLRQRMRAFIDPRPLARHDAEARPEVDVRQLRHVCRICVEPIAALEELGLGLAGAPGEAERLEGEARAGAVVEELGFNDAVLVALRSQAGIARLVLRSPELELGVVLGPAERAARPFVAALEEAAARKRLPNQAARVRVFAAIYLWAGVLVMAGNRQARGRLGLDDQPLTAESAAGFLRRLLRRNLDELAPGDPGFLRRTLDAAVPRVAQAVAGMEARGIHLLEVGPSERMYLDWLASSGAFQWLSLMSPPTAPDDKKEPKSADKKGADKKGADKKSAERRPKRKTLSITEALDARMRALLRGGPERVLKAGAVSPFLEADVPATPARAAAAYARLEPALEHLDWIAPEGGVRIAGVGAAEAAAEAEAAEAWAGVVWEGFQLAMTFARDPAADIDARARAAVAKELTLTRARRRAARGVLGWIGEPAPAPATPAVLARLYDEAGEPRDWDVLIYADARGAFEVPKAALAAAYAPGAEAPAFLARLRGAATRLVDRVETRTGARWGEVSALQGAALEESNARVRAALERLASAGDLLRAFAALCPEGTPGEPGHAFEGERCARCGFGYALTEAERGAFYERWKGRLQKAAALELGTGAPEEPGSPEGERPAPAPPGAEKLLEAIRGGAASAAPLERVVRRFGLPPATAAYMCATAGVVCEEIGTGREAPPRSDRSRLKAICGRIDNLARDVVRLAHGISPTVSRPRKEAGEAGEAEAAQGAAAASFYRGFEDFDAAALMGGARKVQRGLLGLREVARAVAGADPGADPEAFWAGAATALLGLLGEGLELVAKEAEGVARWYLTQFARVDGAFCKVPPGGARMDAATRRLAEARADAAERGRADAMDAEGQPQDEMRREERIRERGAAGEFSMEHVDFEGEAEEDVLS